MSSILFAEHEYQVRDFIRRGLDTNGRWVALGPSAMGCLDRLGKGYEIPEDFYLIHEFQRFCEQTHRQVESLCDFLDERLMQIHPELKDREMRPFNFNIFHLMMIFDAVRSRVFQLGKMFAAFPNETVYVHSGEHAWNSSSLLFSNTATLWGKVASLPDFKAQLTILSDASPGKGIEVEDHGSVVNRRLRRQILKSLALTSASRLITSGDYRGLVNLPTRNQETMLVVNAPYEWANVLPAFSKSGRRILYLNADYFETPVEKRDCVTASDLNDGAGVGSDFRKRFTFEGIDYYSLLKDRLASIWQHAPEQFANVARTMSRLKRRHRISALLRCSCGSGIDHAINQSARILGIPVFVWQHGAVSYGERITQFRDYADRMTSDYLFVYGKDVEEAYTRYGRSFKAQVIPIGAPSLDSIARSNGRVSTTAAKKRNSKVRILYATTNYMQNHWYRGWEPVFSDREFLRDQSVIADYLKEAAETGLAEVVIKFHPSHEYQEPPWKASLHNAPGVREIKNERSFESILAQSDVVVLDFPSTILLQSIATKLPVFVLVRHWWFPAAAREMLDRRAVAASRAGELILRLQEFLESTLYPADVRQTSFLEGYGTYRSDGNSHARAIKTVSSILAHPDRLFS